MPVLHTLVDTDDFETGVAALSETYSKVDLRYPTRADAPFRMLMDMHGNESVTLGRFHLGVKAHVTGRAEGLVTSLHALNGPVESNHGDFVQGAVVGAELTDVRYDHSSLFIVNFTRETLIRHVARDQGADTGTLTLHGQQPEPRYATYWKGVVRHLIEDVASDEDAMNNDLIWAAAIQYLMVAATHALPFEVTTPTIIGTAAWGPTVRRATAFIDSHLQDPVTVADIADAARVSPRGLQATFRRQTGMSPLQYLREARVAQARTELLTSDPATTTIRDIARRWGFANPARFSALYRTLFGELPRDTQRRL